MPEGFDTTDESTRIDEIERQLDDIIDSELTGRAGNDLSLINFSKGARNSADGDTAGVRSSQPIVHSITDVDIDGVSTGIFDKINIISSMAIIDHTSTPITLKYIQGNVKDGAIIKITPELGKIINIEPGGDILTADTIEITDDQYYELVKHSEAATGVTGGAWKILLTGGGGSSAQTPWTQQIEGAGFTLNQAGKIIIKPIQTDGQAGILELIRNDTTPKNNDTVGQILFKGPDDLGNEIIWVAVEGESQDILNTAKQGSYKVSARHDNIFVPIIDYTGVDATFRFSTGVDVVRPNQNGTKEFGTSSFYWDDVFTETITFRGSGGNTTGSVRTIYADGITMVFNMPSGGFTHSVNNKIFSLLTNGEYQIRTELNDGPTIRLRNNDQTPTNNEEVASILFTGNDDLIAERTYGAISVFMNDIGNDSKQAAMSFRTSQNNSLKLWMNFLGASDKVNIFSNLDMNNDDILDMGGGTIDLITEESVTDASNDYLMFYDASANALRKINFASLPPGGGSFLPLDGSSAMTGALVMADHDITFVNDIKFSNSQSIVTSSTIFTFQFNDTTSWRLRKGTTSMIIANDAGIKFSGSVNIGFFGTTPISKKTVTGSKGANAALDSLLTALSDYGLITDNST